MKLVNIIGYSGPSIYIVAISIYALFIYRRLEKEYKLLAQVLFLSGFTEAVVNITVYAGYPSLPGQHLYVILNCLLVSRFYAHLFHGFIKPQIIYAIASVFCVLAILNTLFLQPLMTYDSNSLTLSGILFSTYSIFTYIILFQEIVNGKDPAAIRSLTWINSGFFIFYFYSILIFYFSRYWNASVSISTVVFVNIFSAVNITTYTCLFIGLWLRPRKNSLK